MKLRLLLAALTVPLLCHGQGGRVMDAPVHPLPAADARAFVAEPGQRFGIRDYRHLRDVCWQLETLDLSAAAIDTLPACALHSAHQLRTLILPATLRHIGRQALYACDGLERLVFTGDAVPTLDGEALRLFPRPATFSSPKLADIVQVTGRVADPKDWQRTLAQAEDLPLIETAIEAAEAPLPLIPQPERVVRLDGTFDRTAPVVTRIDPALPAEGYRLHAEGRRVVMEGGDAAGLYYARQTLAQLLAAGAPAVEITDAPRLPIRELMIDPARHFIPYETLCEYVVEMARWKLNVLHLHLVDDQAWRIEIKAYPELTERSSARIGMDDMPRPISGYYTQQQMRDLCALAARHHVTIVPELELPGHEVAAIHALPWLTCQRDTLPIRTTSGVSNQLLCPSRESTYGFIEIVLRELADVFPGPYIHLGGDEAGNPPLDCWAHCADCQAHLARIMADDPTALEALTAAGEVPDIPGAKGGAGGLPLLQKAMFDRVIAFVRDSLQRVPMFWHETDFRQIQPGCITFAWRNGLTQTAIDAAMRCGAQIILCPGEHCYFDYPMARGDMPEVNWGMPVTSLERTYALDPAWGNGPDFESRCLRGVAGTLWTECIPTPERLYYMTYPRALALAEAGWSQASRRDWSDFSQRLRPLVRQMQRRGVCINF